jgi:hypothetical protein
MSIKRGLALALVLALAGGASQAILNAASQATGLISGKANAEAKKPYSDYSVMVRDVATGQVASTVPLNDQGGFSFSNLELSKRYLVELFSTKANKVVCTEGPYVLSPTLLTKTDVNINCGTNPAAYLIAAGAGAAAAIALAVRSASK